MRVILFLCTDNYYRSRFAECYFNHRARQAKLPWLALSRGLTLEFGIKRVGPLSPLVRQELARLNIAIPSDARFPRAVDSDDLLLADRIVALTDVEHRQLVRERFPGWQEAIEYWSIHDPDRATPQAALPYVAKKIDRVVWDMASTTCNGEPASSGHEAGKRKPASVRQPATRRAFAASPAYPGWDITGMTDRQPR